MAAYGLSLSAAAIARNPISDRGQRKQAFYVLQEDYREKAGEQATAGNKHR